MTAPGNPRATPPDEGGDGVRVVHKPRPARRPGLWFKLLAVAVVAGGAGYLLLSKAPAPNAPSEVEAWPVPGPDRAVPAPVDAQAVPLAHRSRATPEVPVELRSLDREDIAAYIQPGDPEPTVAEVIDALHDVGIHSGIGAFNPPGTSPPLEGLAVPADYALPDGYVRHHQVTDAGESIEPILMFSPDVVFRDRQGRPLPIPENRVVPPELAPPGFPLRRVKIPKP